ncbi:MAG: response regulator [Opitutales bacterium]
MFPDLSLTIVEDERLFREMLCRVCQDNFKEVFPAASASEARAIFSRAVPDVLVVDLMLPDGDGVALAEEFIERYPRLRTLALSSATDPFTLHNVVRSRINGYVDKLKQPVDVLIKAIHTVASGEKYFSEIGHEVLTGLKADPEAFYKILSDTELTLLPLFSQGMSNDSVAESVGIRPSTAQWHRRNIMKKLGIHATPELMRYGIKQGFWKARP